MSRRKDLEGIIEKVLEELLDRNFSLDYARDRTEIANTIVDKLSGFRDDAILIKTSNGFNFKKFKNKYSKNDNIKFKLVKKSEKDINKDINKQLDLFDDYTSGSD